MKFLIQAIIFGILNIFSTRSPELSIVLCVVEYILVYYLLIRKKTFTAFLYYVLFTSVSLEMDAFIYGLDEPPFVRYGFFNFPGVYDWAYNLTTVVFFARVYKMDYEFENEDIKKFIQWMKILLLTGSISIAVGVCLNDNNIVDTGLFPKLAISTAMRFSFLFMFFYICAVFAFDKEVRNKLFVYTKYILLSVAVSSLIGLLMGFRGKYGSWSDDTILSAMIFAYTPCLLLFYKKENPNSYVYLFAAIAVFVASFYHPSNIGSKWYLIISGSLFAFLYSALNIRSLKQGLLLLVGILYLIPIVGASVTLFFQSNEFNSWKVMQAFGVLNVFSYSDFESWFNSLDNSAQFRFDEIFNITIEYMNKPMYLIFGKGFGGTTLHYTNFELLDWNADASFTQEQIKHQVFYSMHETTSTIYLRHGLFGFAFMFFIIKMLFKKLNQNPWAMFGLLWFVFFWGWCVSFRLGALAFILAIAYNPAEDSVDEHNKDKD